MDKKLIGLALTAMLAGGVGISMMADAANEVPGDVTPAAPKQDTGLLLTEICVRRDASATLQYRDSFSRGFQVIVRNGTSTGFNYATGETVEVATPNAFTALRGDLGITNARMTNAVTNVRTAGLIVVPGTIH
jgi:hypothetical protein